MNSLQVILQGLKKIVSCLIILLFSISGTTKSFSQEKSIPLLGAEFWIEPHYSSEYIDRMVKIMADNRMPVMRMFIGMGDTTRCDYAFNSAQKYGVKVQLTFTVPEDPQSKDELKKHAETLKLLVNRYKNHPALETWWLMNEPAHGPVNTPLSIQLYRKWLKEKYGTMDNLNRAWKKNYTSPLKVDAQNNVDGFDQIVYSPGWEKSGFFYGEYYDWYRFSADYITWILQWVADEIKKYDNTHVVHVNPHNIFGNLIQYDFPSWRKFLTTLGASIHPSWHFGILKPDQFAMGVAASCEIIKGASEPHPFWISELQSGNNVWSGGRPLGPEAEDIAQWTWTGIGTGAEKVIYWMLSKRTKTGENGDWSLLDYQGNSTDRLEMASRITQTIENEKGFFAGSKAIERKVVILISRESMITLQRKAGKDGLVGRSANAHIFSALAYYQAFCDLGIPATIKFVEDYNWEHKTGNLAIFPNLVTIPKSIANRVETFVANGNKVILDGLTGYFDDDEENVFQTGFFFEKICGATLKDLRTKQNLFKIKLNNLPDSLVVHLWQPEILNHTAKVFAKEGDRILATRNIYGKGEVVWIPAQAGLGAWLSNNKAFTSWLKSESAKIAKSQPIVFAKQAPDVVMSMLENNGEYVTVITNGSDKSTEVSLVLNRKFTPKVIFDTNQKNRTFTPSRFVLDGKQTMVVKWIPILVPATNASEKVSLGKGYALLNTYNVCPENSSGTLLAYTVMTGIPTSDKRGGSAEIWVSHVNETNNAYKLTNVQNASSHNGANVIWIGNNKVAYSTGEDQVKGRVLDVKTKAPVTELEFAISDYNDKNQLGIGETKDEIKVFDFTKNITRTLISRGQMSQFKDKMNGSDDYHDWWISDSRWAPDGEHFSFHITTKGTETSNRHIFTADKNGGDIRFFGLKPMHDGWYENNSLFGHDDQFNDENPNDNTLRVWNRDGKCIIEKLAPPGCHVSVSLNLKWAASETWYTSNPVIFKLYEIGHPKNSKVIMSNKNVGMIWGIRTHVNPAFSKDGKRLYYNNAVSDNISQIYRYNIPQ